jgi:hypothetical protein
MLLGFHAPAFLCFGAAVGLAWWWCHELDGEQRQ